MEFTEINAALRRTDVALERVMQIIMNRDLERVLCRTCIQNLKKRAKELSNQKIKLIEKINEKQECLFVED